jgi:hypothetical protein
MTGKDINWLTLFFLSSFFFAMLIGASGPPIYVRHTQDSRAILVPPGLSQEFLPAEIQQLLDHGESSQLEVSSTKIMIDYMTKKNQFLFVEMQVEKPGYANSPAMNGLKLSFTQNLFVAASAYAEPWHMYCAELDGGKVEEVRDFRLNRTIDKQTCARQHKINDPPPPAKVVQQGKYHEREITCEKDEQYCNPVMVYFAHYLPHAQYKVDVAFEHVGKLYTEYMPEKDDKQNFQGEYNVRFLIWYVNPKYTEFAMGWKYFLWFASMTCAFMPKYGFFTRVWFMERQYRTFQQNWLNCLLLLLTFFNDPFCAIEVYGAKGASNFFSGIYILCLAGFVSMLLFFWLVLFEHLKFLGQAMEHDQDRHGGRNMGPGGDGERKNGAKGKAGDKMEQMGLRPNEKSLKAKCRLTTQFVMGEGRTQCSS